MHKGIQNSHSLTGALLPTLIGAAAGSDEVAAGAVVAIAVG